MKMTTKNLRQAQEKGAKIVCAFPPYAGWEMAHDPRTPRDPKPWRLTDLTDDAFRYGAGELAVEWGPDGEPVALTEIQKMSLKTFVEYGYWAPGIGWVWENRSTTLRIMRALVKKGLAVQTSDEEYRERFEPTEKGRKAVERRLPRPSERDLKIVHVMMAEQDGEWRPGCGWHYKSEAWVRLCLEALVKDGYVAKNGDHYGLKASGFDRAHELGYDPNLIDGV